MRGLPPAGRGSAGTGWSLDGPCSNHGALWASCSQYDRNAKPKAHEDLTQTLHWAGLRFRTGYTPRCSAGCSYAANYNSQLVKLFYDQESKLTIPSSFFFFLSYYIIYILFPFSLFSHTCICLPRLLSLACMGKK